MLGKTIKRIFFNITAWEKLGDLVMQYLQKGRRVLVQGRLRQDSWEDKETGKRQSRIEVTATDVTFLDGPNNDGGSQKPTQIGRASCRERV